MKRNLGFTLIELLVVMGILAILLSIVLIAINPFDHFSKANDLAIKAAVYDLNNAAEIYFATEKEYPWEKNDLCKTELEAGGDFASMGACIKELTEYDKEDLSIAKKNDLEMIHVSKCKEHAVMCYVPKSKEEIKNATYDKWGVVDPGCPKDKDNIGKDCYWCKKVKNEVCEIPPHATLSATLTPSPSPTPTTITCTSGDLAITPANFPNLPREGCFNEDTRILDRPYISAAAGETVCQSITIKDNNADGCNSKQYVLSYAYPTGFSMINMPFSFSMEPGEIKNIPFQIHVPTGATIKEYNFSYWPNNSIRLDGIINVNALSNPPTEQMFSNFGGKFYLDHATFEYSYNAYGDVATRLDISLEPSALESSNYPSPPNSKFSFDTSGGRAWDSSNRTTPSSITGFTVDDPQIFSGWICNQKFYYRIYNVGDLRDKSPILSGTVDCDTQVDVIPWEIWSDARYKGIYNERLDTDSDGDADFDDYWTLIRETRLRYK